MIDYLEDLLEEETAVELTGRPLVPVGRRKIPLREEDETPLRAGKHLDGDGPAEKGGSQEGEPLMKAGRPFWAEEAGESRFGAVRLLRQLSRGVQAAGAVRQQGRSMTVTLAEEAPQAGSLDLETIDRAVQRDARRYDGGFSLY